MAGRIDAASEQLQEALVAATNELGSIPELVLYGGGNSSVKVDWQTVTGNKVPALLVKGTGDEMAGMTAEGFAPLDLRQVRTLLPPTNVGDLAFADELRCATLTSNAPDPSVESLVHALLPHTAVLHSHADAILALTNTDRGAEYVAEVLGPEILIVNYAMPGPDLGAAVYEAWNAAAQRQKGLTGIVVLEHGLFTMADTPQAAYKKHLELVARANEYLTARRPKFISKPTLPISDAETLAKLRREISSAAGHPMIMRRDGGRKVAAFLANREYVAGAKRGSAAPDHAIWSAQCPMVGTDVASYEGEYKNYFANHSARRDVELIQRDPAPRVILDPTLGLLSVGRTAQEAGAVNEIFTHTMATIVNAEALGGYQPAGPGHVFDLEYWAPQQEKLKRSDSHLPLAGKVAVVTGAASGIGRACAQELMSAGAAVVGWDISASVVHTFDSPNFLGIQVDVTDSEAQKRAILAGVNAFGGLDILAVCAGIFPNAQHLKDLDMDMWRRTMSINVDAVAELYGLAFPLLKEAPAGGRVVVIASKNVAAPGPGAAAYSSSKAAITQLSRVAALEWAPHGIHVNMLHPDAVFDTALWTEDLLAKRAGHYNMSIDEYKRRNLLATEVTSVEVGRLAVAMSGDLFSATTGAQVPIDGGNERVI